MTKAELIELAETLGVTVTSKMTKAQIEAAIDEAVPPAEEEIVAEDLIEVLEETAVEEEVVVEVEEEVDIEVLREFGRAKRNKEQAVSDAIEAKNKIGSLDNQQLAALGRPALMNMAAQLGVKVERGLPTKRLAAILKSSV